MVKDELILKLLQELNLQRPKYQKLLDYYEGNHKILYEKPKVDETRADERAYFNYCRKTVQNYTGYLLGKPVNYSSKSGNKEFLDMIDYYFSHWEKEHNINLKQQTEIFGVAYEVAYINTDGEFQCTHFSPLEMIVLHDGSVDRNVSVAVRHYKVEYDDAEYVDVWDDVHYSHYTKDGNKLTLIEQKNHFFSRCPVIEVPNNDLKKSAFEDIIRIVDMYNKIHSTAGNEIIDHRQAYLVIENADLSFEEAQKMKENGILLVPQGSKVYWATKDINGAFVKDMLKDWQDEIYIQTNQVNLNENFQSNTSGISIRLKLQELENISAIKESIFEKVLKKRLKFFCEWLKLAKNKEYDWRDISISFSRNIPVDEKMIADMVKELYGLLPHEELISWLPRVTNPAASIQKLKEEQDTMNLDQIGDSNG
ncbi:phage portal protein [Saccharococcus thermophilus]|uniref:SPP1 family phage portal protein n=1 Tax=Saccharococcus thermophilus TaxID=29396 RepID=A0A846MF42_9BACL|nr:SPP1 family phage portal protein [Saccharococcus thermophilus]